MNTETTPAKKMRDQFSADAATLASIRVQLCDLVEQLALRLAVVGDVTSALNTRNDAAMAISCLAEVERTARIAVGRAANNQGAR